MYPFLIHYGATMLATIALYLSYIFQAGGVQEIARAGKRLLQSTLYVTLIGDVAAGVILYLFYRKDQQRRKEGFSGNRKNFVWAPPVIWFSVIVLAIAIGQFLNDFIQVIHLNDLFPGYSQVSEKAFGGQSMGLMILVVGIIGPVCEELMFRGIIFHRLKDWIRPEIAIVVSAVWDVLTSACTRYRSIIPKSVQIARRNNGTTNAASTVSTARKEQRDTLRVFSQAA